MIMYVTKKIMYMTKFDTVSIANQISVTNFGSIHLFNLKYATFLLHF
jgi:hypothetical protein